ncbi:ankyrin, partial [Acephala macrosclerotiorum]
MDMVKLLWNEDGMRQHLEQLRAQSNALSLLLQVLQTGALSDVKNDLQGVLAAVVELSISTTTNPPDVQSSGIQDRNQIHILDEQGDLIEFDLLEESQQWSALDAPGRATHLEMLERSFAFENISDSEEDMPMKPGRSHRSEAAGSMERLHKAMQASQQECLPSSSRLLVEPQDFRTSSRSRLLNDSARRSESPASNFSADSDTAESRPSEAVVLDDPSPMILSATKGDLVNVTALLDAGGNIESCDQNRRTSLILAAYHGHDELLKFLLERGANVDAIDVDKRTALHYAASEGSSACTELLLLSGASVDIRDFIGETP